MPMARIQYAIFSLDSVRVFCDLRRELSIRYLLLSGYRKYAFSTNSELLGAIKEVGVYYRIPNAIKDVWRFGD